MDTLAAILGDFDPAAGKVVALEPLTLSQLPVARGFFHGDSERMAGLLFRGSSLTSAVVDAALNSIDTADCSAPARPTTEGSQHTFDASSLAFGGTAGHRQSVGAFGVGFARSSAPPVLGDDAIGAAAAAVASKAQAGRFDPTHDARGSDRGQAGGSSRSSGAQHLFPERPDVDALPGATASGPAAAAAVAAAAAATATAVEVKVAIKAKLARGSSSLPSGASQSNDTDSGGGPAAGGAPAMPGSCTAESGGGGESSDGAAKAAAGTTTAAAVPQPWRLGSAFGQNQNQQQPLQKAPGGSLDVPSTLRAAVERHLPMKGEDCVLDGERRKQFLQEAFLQLSEQLASQGVDPRAVIAAASPSPSPGRGPSGGVDAAAPAACTISPAATMRVLPYGPNMAAAAGAPATNRASFEEQHQQVLQFQSQHAAAVAATVAMARGSNAGDADVGRGGSSGGVEHLGGGFDFLMHAFHSYVQHDSSAHDATLSAAPVHPLLAATAALPYSRTAASVTMVDAWAEEIAAGGDVTSPDKSARHGNRGDSSGAVAAAAGAQLLSAPTARRLPAAAHGGIISAFAAPACISPVPLAETRDGSAGGAGGGDGGGAARQPSLQPSGLARGGGTGTPLRLSNAMSILRAGSTGLGGGYMDLLSTNDMFLDSGSFDPMAQMMLDVMRPSLTEVGMGGGGGGTVSGVSDMSGSGGGLLGGFCAGGLMRGTNGMGGGGGSRLSLNGGATATAAAVAAAESTTPNAASGAAASAFTGGGGGTGAAGASAGVAVAPGAVAGGLLQRATDNNLGGGAVSGSVLPIHMGGIGDGGGGGMLGLLNDNRMSMFDLEAMARHQISAPAVLMTASALMASSPFTAPPPLPPLGGGSAIAAVGGVAPPPSMSTTRSATLSVEGSSMASVAAMAPVAAPPPLAFDGVARVLSVGAAAHGGVAAGHGHGGGGSSGNTMLAGGGSFKGSFFSQQHPQHPLPQHQHQQRMLGAPGVVLGNPLATHVGSAPVGWAPPSLAQLESQPLPTFSSGPNAFIPPKHLQQLPLPPLHHQQQQQQAHPQQAHSHSQQHQLQYLQMHPGMHPGGILGTSPPLSQHALPLHQQRPLLQRTISGSRRGRHEAELMMNSGVDVLDPNKCQALSPSQKLQHQQHQQHMKQQQLQHELVMRQQELQHQKAMQQHLQQQQQQQLQQHPQQHHQQQQQQDQQHQLSQQPVQQHQLSPFGSHLPAQQQHQQVNGVNSSGGGVTLGSSGVHIIVNAGERPGPYRVGSGSGSGGGPLPPMMAQQQQQMQVQHQQQLSGPASASPCLLQVGGACAMGLSLTRISTGINCSQDHDQDRQQQQGLGSPLAALPPIRTTSLRSIRGQNSIGSRGGGAAAVRAASAAAVGVPSSPRSPRAGSGSGAGPGTPRSRSRAAANRSVGSGSAAAVPMPSASANATVVEEIAAAGNAVTITGAGGPFAGHPSAATAAAPSAALAAALAAGVVGGPVCDDLSSAATGAREASGDGADGDDAGGGLRRSRRENRGAKLASVSAGSGGRGRHGGRGRRGDDDDESYETDDADEDGDEDSESDGGEGGGGARRHRRRSSGAGDEEGGYVDEDSVLVVRAVRDGVRREITKHALRKVYHLPINEAAAALNIGVTVLKKYCRKFRVPRWPYRKLQSMGKLIESFEKYKRTAILNADTDGAERCEVVIQTLLKFREDVYDNPDKDIDESVKKLRQANFKIEYRQRQGQPNGIFESGDLGTDFETLTMQQSDAATAAGAGGGGGGGGGSPTPNGNPIPNNPNRCNWGNEGELGAIAAAAGGPSIKMEI